MASEYLSLIAEKLGITVGLLLVLLFWSLVWKLLALWKSARNNSIVWFIVIAITNTVGILPILYLFIFSKIGKKKSKKRSKK